MIRKINTALTAVAIAVCAFMWLGDPSYNCHNYAWETERRWLEDPSDYIARATPCGPDEATRVVYYRDGAPVHSGQYIGSGWVRSKWGSNPVVVHPVTFSTYGADVRYYR